MTIGEIIRQERIERGFSQKYLANLIGATPQQLSQWENGTRIPKANARRKIAEALTIPTHRLYDEEPTSSAASKQAIVTWYTPDECLPPQYETVPATVSGKSRNVIFDHALVMASYCEQGGWSIEDFCFDDQLKGSWLKVHAWADLEPYYKG